MSIRTKLVLSGVAVSLITAGLIGFTAYAKSRAAIEKQINNHLSSSALSRANNVANYIVRQKQMLSMLADSNELVAGMQKHHA